MDIMGYIIILAQEQWKLLSIFKKHFESAGPKNCHFRWNMELTQGLGLLSLLYFTFYFIFHFILNKYKWWVMLGRTLKGCNKIETLSKTDQFLCFYHFQLTISPVIIKYIKSKSNVKRKYKICPASLNYLTS